MPSATQPRRAAALPSLAAYAWLSIAAALATMALKGAAWWITGSVGLLSDAVESLVNLAAALFALWTVRFAALPADDTHPYGHAKAEYFAGALEGALIVLAALAIAAAALPRLAEPRALVQIGPGLALSAAAAAINLGAALVLLRAGRRHRSIVLEADGQHLLTDVWTSVAVIGGVAAVAATGWLRLDPLVAIAVAAHIAWTGAGLVRRAVAGLMDASLPAADVAAVKQILESLRVRGVDHHALRTRQSGRNRFVSVHLLVPEAWTVGDAHRIAEEVEQRIREALPGCTPFTHLEPLEHPESYQDIELHR